jgi:inner membrane protein
MDPLTQGTLGAAWAQAGTSIDRVKHATWLGVLGGILPDADTLIRSSTDTLLALEYHRHFTHSLVFIPIGGLIAAGIGHLLSRRRISVKDAYLPCTLGYASHGLLDACTSYGTYLLWPFSSARIAWNNISIVDPLFTLPLIVAVVWTFRTRHRRPIQIGLLYAALYLLLGVGQRHRALGEQVRLAEERGHVISRGDAKPSFANNVVFRSTYQAGGQYHVDAIRVGYFSDPKVYTGESIAVLDRGQFEQKYGVGAIKSNDIDRFAYFSDNYLIEHPTHPGVLGDLRYAMLPNQLDPLWGIDVTANESHEHAVFRQFQRPIDAEGRATFWRMLLGR